MVPTVSRPVVSDVLVVQLPLASDVLENRLPDKLSDINNTLEKDVIIIRRGIGVFQGRLRGANSNLTN
jgi:hypothetical protein